ncbi:MAG: short-chain dehydrogenase/reductase [Schumannella sp.]|nr:short-chain dehydrogenase/reductase [Schumannella sp.]
MGIHSGKVAIVTGGARGIGQAVARRLQADGARVAIWDLTASAHMDPSAGYTPDFSFDVDVSDFASVEAGYDATVEALGPIDILVNNAGINGPVNDVQDYPLEAWDRVLAIDLTGVFYCTRVALADWVGRGSGRIVNIASIAGKEGGAGIAAYAAAKAGVIGFTKSVARELSTSGILVNAIAPAITETALFEEMTPEHIAAGKSKIPMGRPVNVEEIASLATWIAGPDCTFTTGFVFDISGGRATY